MNPASWVRSPRIALTLLALAASAITGCPASPTAPSDAGPSDDTRAVDGSLDTGSRCTTAADCDDGLFCNGDEACTAGRCVGGMRACDDGVACTVDSCSEERLRCENRAPDADADGYGDAACVDGTGTPLGNDCDDGDDTRFPGNAEVCDDVGHDEDCDGATLGGLDADGDGVESDACCNPMTGGGRTCGADCDDGRRQVNPSGTEVCDGIDDDCDGMIDDGVTVTVYEDADHDGHGDPARSSMACAGVAGLVALGDDCDDTRVDRHPAQLEFCDGVDNDCDGTIDDNTGPVRWYTDSDGDGFGSAASGAVDSCAPIPGASLLGTDCNDARASVSPAAAEMCDGLDNDCSGRADFAIAPGDFEDDDSDGYVDIGCGPPLGIDCEDDNASAGPGEPEACDGRDNDCDASVDEDVTTYAWFLDADGDGYGTDEAGLIVSCLVIGGHVRRGGDCDDGASESNPAATERCSGRDEDCDGAVDEAPASDECVDTLGADRACVAGSCRSVGCLPGRADCDGSSANGCETMLASDPLRCGSCGVACPTAPSASSACSAGTCGPLGCTGGRLDCDGDLTSPTGNGCESSVACPLCVTDAGCDDGVVCNGRERCDTAMGVCQPGGGPPDADGDTQTPVACGGTDCDDLRADVRVGGIEICDGVDQDCDGTVDDGATDASTWYRDGDSDGAGDPSSSIAGCVAPSGYVATGSDCDDARADVGPGRIEVCDAVDQDCDSIVDEAAPTAPTWYRDFDGDGSGDPATTAIACAAPSGHVSNGNDCDDTRAAVRPGAPEVCNGLDDDCDSLTDSADPGVTDATTWFRDVDMDGAGDATQTIRACAMPAGYRPSAGDCDDTRPEVGPGAPEVCDGVDNDCDGLLDDADSGVGGTTTWFRDFDGDGVGDPLSSVAACAMPPGYLSSGTDCDDTRASVRPGAPEICDGLDDDCDTLVDDADPSRTGGSTWFRDLDGDGAGTPGTTTLACGAPAGFVSSGGDCDDTRASVRPGAPEICNGLDDDCDTLVDDADPGRTGGSTWFRDLDGDGFGDGGSLRVACVLPVGYAGNGSDCDDTRTSVRPGAPEICDGLDNDCDMLTDSADPSLTGAPTWYRDLDGDGAGDPASPLVACTMPGGYVPTNADCDDTRPSVRPGAPEICNGLDDDCDSFVDDADPSRTGGATWFRDFDDDGAGDPVATTVACVVPAGYVATGSDCDDTRSTVNPGATEICDSLDNDCDTLIDDADPTRTGGSIWYRDLDGDAARNPASTTLRCTMPGGYLSGAAPIDCDDTRPDVRPGAPEVCDGVDNDCDTLVDSADPGVSGASTWYRDLDVDGAGNPGDSTFACFMPGGYVGNATDCDDTRPDVRPGEPEVCNGIDNDCDAIVDEPPTDCGGGATCIAGVCEAPFPSSSADLSVVRTQGSCADGGDMVSYSVLALTPTTATLLGAPSAGCLVPGDEVLLINLQGSPGPSPNVGNWELLTVASVAGGVVTFAAAKSQSYGDGAGDDSNLGTGAGNQRVILQRVPSYGAVTLAAGADYTASGWNGARGGVFAMRATSVSGSGRITMTGRGYRGGVRNFSPGATGEAGESSTGLGSSSTGPNGGGGGGGGGDPCVAPGLGAGGGGGAYGGTAAASEFGGGCGGSAGLAYGDPMLTRLFLGSGGGSGGTDNTLIDNPPGGAGGAGGGIALVLGASVSSNVEANGLAGEGDPTGVECTNASTTDCWDFSGPGGGGSGGSVRIDGSFPGIGSVAGGAGGNGYAGGAGDGGDGSIGRIVPTMAATVPPVAAGLIAHFNARVPGSLITSGPSLVAWNDLSGFNRNLGPTFAAPTVGTANIAGRPAVDFTAAGMVRSGPGIPLAPSASITVFVAMGARVPNQWGAIVHHGSRDGDWSIEQSGFDPADVSHFQSVNDNSGAELTLTPGTDYVLCGRITGATRYFSATTGGSTAVATASGNSIIPSNLNFYVGASDANERSNAIIGEVVYYDRSLTDPERDAVIAYLTAAWGI